MEAGKYQVVEMNETYGRDISGWKYPSPYERYGFDGTESEFQEVMNGLHFAVLDSASGELCGFLCIGWSAQVRCRGSRDIYQDESYTDFGLGLRPDLTDKGLGEEFIKACMEGVREMFPEDGLRLTVIQNNQRAIKCYKKAGFRTCHTFKKFFLSRVRYDIMILA